MSGAGPIVGSRCCRTDLMRVYGQEVGIWNIAAGVLRTKLSHYFSTYPK